MKYYVSAQAKQTGDGTQEAPFLTIQEAAAIAVPGDEVIVAPGIYREYVNPINAGTKEQPIIYRAEVSRSVVITGAESIKNWEPYEGDTWKVCLPNEMFGDYNPYTTLLSGDWYYSEIPLHTGEVYLNGKQYYETDTLESVMNSDAYPGAWNPDGAENRWCTEQDGDATVIYANFHGKNPNEENVEINVRRNCFYPDKTGVNYITVQGFIVRQAATTWAPPTAYQDGMIGPHWSKGWVIEDCEISDSKCSGITLGKYLQPENENKWSLKRLKHGTQTERDAILQAQREGWTKETIGSHTVRGCEIHDCGQTGIVGHLGCVFSLIENNHIHHINNKQQLTGAEIGGIKLHAAIDTTIRGNHIHHCTRGLWLDWQAQGTRVSKNLFHDNLIPDCAKLMSGLSVGHDLFIEVSHGPTLVDNNIFLTSIAGNLASQGMAFVHNLIAGCFISIGAGTNNAGTDQPRYTPYHVQHRTEVAGFMTFLHGDDRFYNNIFVHKDVPERIREHWAQTNAAESLLAGIHAFDEYPLAEEYFARFFDAADVGARENRGKYYDKLPVYTGGNVYFNGAKPCVKEQNFRVAEQEIRLELVEKDGKYYLDTDLYEYLPEFVKGQISTEVLGEAFEPEQLFENPDGTPIIFNSDYFGESTGSNPLPGPFAGKEESTKALY